MPESTKKLDEIYRLAKENNKMLRKMRRAAFWGLIFKIVLYAILLGIPLFFYFSVVQPLLNDTVSAFQQVQATGENMQNAGTGIMLQFQSISDLLNIIPGVDFTGNPPQEM